MLLRIPAGLLGLAFASGCLADELDPPPSGVFACESVEECPEGQSCLFGLCQEGTLPTLEIRAPEPRAVIGTITPENPGPAELVVTVSIGGRDLELVSRGEEPKVGEGVVEVFVDDETVPQVTLTAGSLTAGVPAELTFPNTPGVHRIRALATLADGRRYENTDSSTTSVVWVNDGLPHVAVERPAPGTVFGVDDVETEVEITALNFDFVQASTDRDPGNVGHAHVHYDELFPACVDDPGCDNGYIGIISPTTGGSFASAAVTVVLPASGEGFFNFTAVLRHTDHVLFAGDDGNVLPVFDNIMIERDASVQSSAQDGDEG